jgi:hypothetical protein
MSEWQPIDTAPTDGRRFLVFATGECSIGPAKNKFSGVFVAWYSQPSIIGSTRDERLAAIEKTLPPYLSIDCGSFSKAEAKHWMPFPDPPR